MVFEFLIVGIVGRSKCADIQIVLMVSLFLAAFVCLSCSNDGG